MESITRNNLGALPQFVYIVGKLMLDYQLNAAAAARQAAAEFDYFQAVSEAELTEISFEMARQHPEYKYWEWFSILRNIRDYGMLDKPGPVPGKRPSPAKAKGQALYWWIAGGIIAAMLLLRRN